MHATASRSRTVSHGRGSRAIIVTASVLACVHANAGPATPTRSDRPAPANRAAVAAPPASQATGIPSRLSDSSFWQMVTDFSEPGGYFRSDNFVSNETSFQYVIPELQRTTRPGGVYLGVAPDQNFTYLVAL